MTKIDSWIANTYDDEPVIFWLSGPAGTGKSTIAQTVAEKQAARERLGASFFFSRDRASQKDALLLFPTLAFQLACVDPEYKQILANILKMTPDAAHADIRSQSRRLMSEACFSLRERREPFVIVIDALDECEPDSGAEIILEAWATDPGPFRGKIKLLITSRPEHRIHTKLQQLSHHIHHDISQLPVQDDILTYLQYHLNLIAIRCDVEIPWPKQDVLEKLMARTDAFFIWAATAVKFIGDEAWNDPEHQMQVLLDRDGHALGTVKTIDSLYMTVLSRAIPSDDPALSDRFRTVVGAVLLIQDPMSAQTLEDFLSLSRGTVLRTLRQLRSVILIPDRHESPIRVFHQSFPEFLTNSERCEDPRFVIDAPAVHFKLGTLCLKQLSALRRDICDIRDATRLNSEVPDLEDRLGRAVPNFLRYACLHFASHISASASYEGRFTKLITDFCNSKILAWIETVSYLGHLEVVGPALKSLRTWYAVSVESSSLSYVAANLWFVSLRRSRPGVPVSCYMTQSG